MLSIMQTAGFLAVCGCHQFAHVALFLPEGSPEEGMPVVESLPTLTELRERCRLQLKAMRSDHIRGLNATPYKVRETIH